MASNAQPTWCHCQLRHSIPVGARSTRPVPRVTELTQGAGQVPQGQSPESRSGVAVSINCWSRTSLIAACEDVARVDLGWLAGPPRSPAGPDAHSSDHCGREEDQRGCYGTHADRYERGARFRSDIRSGRRWRWIETKRFRHVMPPEDLKIDGVPAEYPDDAADPPQPSHRQTSGSCPCCLDLVYHGCWLVTRSSAAAGRHGHCLRQ
jgi:hypothetical protein